MVKKSSAKMNKSVETYSKIIDDSPYKPKQVKVIDYLRETLDTFTIKLDWNMVYEPGQFVFCSLPGIGEAPISICSYSQDYVELNIRQVGNVTNGLANIKFGDYLLVRGPYGKPYPMSEFKGKNIIVIGGGCGVAPLKGTIEFIEKHRSDFKDVHLFLGFRNPDETLFKRKLDVWIKSFNMKISFDKIISNTCYDGKQGFITSLVDENVKDPKDMVVFICGPPIMMQKASEILLKKGFKENQIYLSAERLMYCGMGKCGRCMIHGKYTCLDGAVFRFDELKDFKDD